jgi:hypothetical protein
MPRFRLHDSQRLVKRARQSCFRETTVERKLREIRAVIAGLAAAATRVYARVKTIEVARTSRSHYSGESDHVSHHRGF